MLRQTFLSPRFHYTFGPHEPMLRIEPGASLRVVCPDSDNMLSDGSILTLEQRQQCTHSRLFEGNPLAGPIFVEGARPGDCVSVHIDAIMLDRTFGQTGLAPGSGLLPLHALLDGAKASIPRHLYRWDLDANAGVARLSNALGKDPVSVPLDPFVGCIGTCPQHGQSISTIYARDFGGNMDIPAIRPDATVLLPVHCPGALVLMGDVHAAQGHGEIIGGAIETSGMVDCTIGLLKGRSIAGPRVQDASRLMAIASHGDLRTAVQTACVRLLDWLCEFSTDRCDAYNLISQTCSIVLGNCVTAPYTLGAAVPIGVLPERVRQSVAAG